MNENLKFGQNLDNSGQICATFAYNGNKAREINLPERSQRNRKGAVYMTKIC